MQKSSWIFTLKISSDSVKKLISGDRNRTRNMEQDRLRRAVQK
ncbi:MAG: hypothetical protein ACLUUO_02580 [Sellimonas intestinalis]